MRNLFSTSTSWLLTLLTATIVCTYAASIATADDQAQHDFFEKKVRPLLVKHCYECHSSGADELKGGLSLDTRSGWELGGDSGAAIEPGKPEESLLIESLNYESYEMPPAGKLKSAEIAVFEKWISDGAYDPRESSTPAVPAASENELDLEQARQFWSFQPPQTHAAPEVKNNEWPTDDLDRFVLARLEEANLAPAADADRTTWLRRVTYDLTGLPPTADQLEAFLADDSQQAHATVVDRLLASPQFGEHWGRHWLDVARYADSNGSDFNATFFNAWRYRNYVIGAFNTDKPYDQFVREQIAGDLLDYESDSAAAQGLIATGFLMIGPKMLSERDKDKLYMDVVDEQVDSVGRAFMGLTLGCARCHDHKFDPIPTEDYYALAGIFRSTLTLEGESQQYVSAWKEVDLPLDPALKAAWDEHNQQVKQADQQIASAKKQLAAAEKRLKALKGDSAGIVVDDQQAEKVGKWKASTYSPNFVGKGYVHDEKMGQGTKSITFRTKLPHDGMYEVRMSYPGSSGRDDKVPVTIIHADGQEKLKVDQTKSAPINNLYKSLGKFSFSKEKAAEVTISNMGTSGYVIADAVQFLPLDKPTDDQLVSEEEARMAAELEEKRAAVQAQVEQFKKELAAQETAKKELAKAAPEPPPQAMAVRESGKIDDIAVCIRGEVHRPGEIVPRGFVRVVSPGEKYQVTTDKRSGRAQLANWMTSKEHPLTSRVMVNRIWHHMFGRGLVSSVDNFGKLGQRPSHQRLLDTLAVEFAESGWSVKQLVRRLALSRTYRQSAAYSEEAYAADPDNALLWRASRKRVPAEAIRDSMLAAAGRLDPTQGKSPVKGMGRLAIDNNKQGNSGRDTSTEQRSIYLPIIRNDLPELLTTFDMADPDLVVGARPVTNVPAQSLMLLNSPFVHAIAEDTVALAAGSTETEEARVETLYLRILSRPPTEQETLQAQTYVASEATASGLAAEAARQAAWVKLAQALIGSTEFRLLD